jgi:hypothetical protein
MADKDMPEEAKDKKKGLLGTSKVPLDAVLLVVVPFVTFVMLFMYVMGLLPPRPMTVKVVGAAPVEETTETESGHHEESVIPEVVESPAAIVSAVEAPGQEDNVSVHEEPADTISAESGGDSSSKEIREETGPSEPVTVDASEGPRAESAEVDEDRLERIKQLAKVYEQMNASSVAAIVTTMNENDAVDILSNMKPRNAAKVLASLAPEKAATLSIRLTE